MKLGDNTDCVLSNFIVDTDIILWLGRVSQIMAKTKTTEPKIWHAQNTVFVQLLVRYVKNSMLAKLQMNFPRDGHRSIWNKPDCKDDKDHMVLTRQFPVFHGIVNKPLTHETHTVTL